MTEAILSFAENRPDPELIAFLLRAKRATYAGKGKEAPSSRPASHDLDYREGELRYIDSYLGGERFTGEEALWIHGIPIWSMNYTGRVTDRPFSGDFLKQALLRVTEEKPFRGPDSYSDGEYDYICSVRGGFEWFDGEERIRFCGKPVYECRFHGGIVK